MGGYRSWSRRRSARLPIEVPPRTPRPVRRFDLLAGLGAVALASAAYVTAVIVTEVPPRGAAVVLLGAAPLCGLFALAVLAVRARAEDVPALSWASGGLVVSVVAMVLQLVSFPTVSPYGGVLGTSPQSNAALYLLFHLAWAAGAAAGALGAASPLRGPAVAAGVIVAVLLGVDAIPLPLLLRPDGSFTPTLDRGGVRPRRRGRLLCRRVGVAHRPVATAVEGLGRGGPLAVGV